MVISALDNEPWVEIRIADNGPGIRPGDLALIFEEMYRARDVGRIPGSGVGLSLVRTIVERHDGSIAVSGEYGEGATFTVRLPMAHVEGRPVAHVP
jgi:signal transduction histidine kinase